MCKQRNPHSSSVLRTHLKVSPSREKRRMASILPMPDGGLAGSDTKRLYTATTPPISVTWGLGYADIAAQRFYRVILAIVTGSAGRPRNRP